jgi:hypothetical protein
VGAASVGAALCAAAPGAPPVRVGHPKSLSGDLRCRRVVDLAGVLHRGDEVVELIAREAALAAGRPVAVDVAGVGPATDRGERDADVAGRLGAREDELPVAWGWDGPEGHGLPSCA